MLRLTSGWTSILRRGATVATVVFFGACGGSDGPTDPGGDGGGGGGGGGGTPRVVKANPEFGADIQEIFDRRGCTASGCHGSAQSAGLDLRSGSAYGSLVNVMASSEAIVRVIPNDAQGSYLVIKLEGRQSVGERMPRGASPLDATDLTNIRNWIDTGAPNN
jgi:hypothetical protein